MERSSWNEPAPAALVEPRDFTTIVRVQLDSLLVLDGVEKIAARATVFARDAIASRGRTIRVHGLQAGGNTRRVDERRRFGLPAEPVEGFGANELHLVE